MHSKLIALVVSVIVIFNYCTNNQIVLQNFKKLKYKKCFISNVIAIENYEAHYIYIENLNLRDYEKLSMLQEFSICYGRKNTYVGGLVFLNKCFSGYEDYSNSSKKVSIRLFRTGDSLAIRSVLYFKDNNTVKLNIPIVLEHNINCN